MARDFIIQYQQHVSRLSENEANEFLKLLERNGIITSPRREEILHSGRFNFNAVVDHFSHNPSHQFSFLEFARSPLGRNFRDLPAFLHYTQDFGADVFQDFWERSQENPIAPELRENPTFLYFRGPNNPHLHQSSSSSGDSLFWTRMIDQWGLSIYLGANPSVQANPDIARYALRMADDGKNVASICKLLAGHPTLEDLRNDEGFFLYAVTANPAIVELLPPRLSQNEAFMLSLCRKNFNVLSYLPEVLTRRLWPLLLRSYHLDPQCFASYSDFLTRLKQWMTEPRRLHRLDAAFELLQTHERAARNELDTRLPIFLMYPDPSADPIGYFRIREDLDSLILSNAHQHRFLYVEAGTPDEVFMKLDFFTHLIGQRGQLIWSAHGDENGLQLSYNSQSHETEYFRASDFEGRGMRQFISGWVYLAACSAGEHLSRRFATLNPGLSFSGPDRLIEGSLYLLQHSKIFPLGHRHEQFLSSKS